MSAAAAIPRTPPPAQRSGLAVWMQRVLEECDRAAVDFAPDPVHDLRVALRRCRSLADGLMALDPDAAWKQMKKAGKGLFRVLGELRDTQVMVEWVNQLGVAGDPVASTLLCFLAFREAEHKQQAVQALAQFDRKQWKKWSRVLPRRAARIRTGSLLFRHLALERWTEAYELGRRALRARSPLAWHALRIGLKRFRYIVENFLPAQHESWIDDLKQLQDWLGEVHDLDVLWSTALRMKVFPDDDARIRWRERILEERNRRIQGYRERMVGKNSRWQHWRAQLPEGREIETAAFSRLRLWASLLDPDFPHSRHVARLALELYDGVFASQEAGSTSSTERTILRLAALLHDVGRSREQKRHHKVGSRMIEKLAPPLGWTPATMHLIAVVSRYHRGALPRRGQKMFDRLAAAERQTATKLTAILRLANAFDQDRSQRIDRLKLIDKNGALVILARGYSPWNQTAESIAAARHLLEVVCRRPILVKTMRANLH
ncbi:MAG TPA: CHAD domain-containing protein [Terriglobales bacterium]|nr:CHAD domain-containing protein [Terriglobales bacterium]